MGPPGMCRAALLDGGKVRRGGSSDRLRVGGCGRRGAPRKLEGWARPMGPRHGSSELEVVRVRRTRPGGLPSRIALAVSSGVDSRTIIDMNGAEKLLGKGDMLFYPQGYPKPARVQGAFLSDSDIAEVVKFLSAQANQILYNNEVEEKIIETINNSGSDNGGTGGELDEYFVRAGRFIIEKDKASIGMLQRIFKIGFNRAARIMDQLCEAGVVGPEEGTKPRKILMSREEFENKFGE